MKNVRFIAAAFVLAFAVSSCSKNYNCHCVYKTNGSVTHEDDTKISENKQSAAKSSCDQMDASSTSTVSGSTVVNTTECELN